MHFFCKFTLAKKNKQPLVVWLYIFTPLLRDLETKTEKKITVEALQNPTWGKERPV